MANQVTAPQWMGMRVLMGQPRSEAEPLANPPLRAWTVWVASLLSAGLLYLSFFPVACGWLAWVAWVPWLCLVRAPGRSRRLYLISFVGAAAFFVPVLQWMRVADPRMYLTWGALALWCALHVTVMLFLVRLLDRRTRLPLVLTFPLVLVAVEYWRYGFLGSFASILLGTHQHDYPGGFGWYCLGHSQHDFLELIQIADLTGVYGVCFVVAAVNALLFEMLCARAWFRSRFLGDAPARGSRFALLVQGVGVAGLLAVVLGYGMWRLGQEAITPGPRIALLQGDVPQSVRTESTSPGEGRKKVLESLEQYYKDLSTLAARQGVDLIVWPETSWPHGWGEIAPGEPTASSQKWASASARRLRTPQLIGANASVLIEDKVRSYNSAVLIDSRGRWLDRYDKIHRVPFGEYVPVRSWLPWLNRLAPYDYDYSVAPGEQFTRFVLPGKGKQRRFGVVICYEDTDPAMALPYVGEDGGVDFLVNISNDGWFDGTSEHEQHLAICRFRAIECRRSVARAVNMGISAVIDSNGRVLAPEWQEKGDFFLWTIPEKAKELPVSRWREYKQVAGVVVAAIPMDGRGSFYARWGDWFSAGCGAMLLLSLVLICFRRFRESPP